MSDNTVDNRALIIFGCGLLFIVATVLVLFGAGKYTGMFKDKAVELIKESAPESEKKDLEVNSADSTFLKNDLGGTGSGASSLGVGTSIADYGFKMDVEKAAQQQDAVEEYAVPSVPPGQPGSPEWQEQFWKDR